MRASETDLVVVYKYPPLTYLSPCTHVAESYLPATYRMDIRLKSRISNG